MRLHRPIRAFRRARPLVALAAAVWVSSLAAANPPDPESDWIQIYSIVVPYANGNDLGTLTQLLDHPYVDQKARTVSAEVGPGELARLRMLGLPVQINEAETTRIRNVILNRPAPKASEKPGEAGLSKSIADGTYACYRTVEQVYGSFDDLAARYPKFVKVQTLGKTWMGNRQQTPSGDTGDNSNSSFANLLIKYLPESLVKRFNLALLPTAPSPIKVIVAGNFEKQDAQAEKPPNMVWTGGIHAREYAPQEVGMKYIEWLLANYETDANARMMLDTNRYHFIIHNPDGRKLAEQDMAARQRKNTNYETAACTVTTAGVTTNTLDSGVDLNRNYPFGWATGGSGGSDGNKCGQTYRGTRAASEPETQAVLAYVRGTWNQAACKWEGGALPDGRPKSAAYCNAENRDNGGAGELDWKTGADDNYGGGVFIDLHSAARAILWPWGVERTENDNNTHTPNNKGMAVIAQRMAFHSNYSAQQLLGYNTEGTTKDAVYGYLGAPAYTVEMGRTFYEDCEIFKTETYPENFNGFHYLSRVLHRPYQLPFGPDTINVQVDGQAISAGGKVAITATVDDNRYRYAKAGQPNIKPPPVPVVYNIKSAMAYIDKLPWEAGAVGIPLALATSDQAKPDFPDATRTANGVLDTTGLVAGRHMVYVQGTNDDGKAGSVSAAFLNVKAADATAPPEGPAVVMPMGTGRRGGGALGWSDLVLVLLGLAGLAGARRRRG